MSFAQTQQGFVKTKGRMVDGKHVPGQGLKGATVSIRGRTTVLVKADDGAFSFPMPETQFHLDSVRKKGYQLVDMDACPRTYKHSSNPIYLVMETPEQQLQDQLAAERKIRRTLTNQLHEREDEIETLKEQQKITDERYRQALQKLYEETNQNEQLVKDMVERYSKIDYDQLSEFDKQISEYILNGELTKADSLLRTKGDINKRVSLYRQHESTNAKEKEELTRRNVQLKQSEALAIQERDDLANDCYRKFEVFKIQHLNDSAAYYLELRASLDSTNVKWVLETGRFIRECLANYSKTASYYQLALRQAQLQFGEESENAANCYNNMGLLCKKLGNYDKALEYYKKALLIWESNKSSLDMASCCCNLGSLYIQLNEYEKAFDSYYQAMEIVDSASCTYAEIMNGIGILYDKQEDFVNALCYKEKALQVYVSLLGYNDPTIANCFGNIGTTYYHMGEYDKAIEYHEKASLIWQQVFGPDHPDVALCYNDIAQVLSIKNQFDLAIEYMLNAIDIFQITYGMNNKNTAFLYKELGNMYIRKQDYTNAQQYTEKALAIYLIYDTETDEIASCYNSIGVIKNREGDYEDALQYYLSALNIKTKVFGENSLQAAYIYNNLIGIYDNLKDYEKSQEYAEKALEIRIQKLGEMHDDVASSYNGIGVFYYRIKEYDKALMSFTKAYEIWTALFGTEHLNVADVSSNIAALLIQLGEYERSIEYYKQAINTYSSIIGEQCLQVGIFNSAIGDAYFALGRYSEALPYYLKSIETRKVVQGENHPKIAEIQDKISEIQSKLIEQEND